MPEIDDNSIDCIITSPPYWGLRDYGKEVNQIWGGNSECKHQWGSKICPPSGEHYHGQGKSTLRDGNVSPDEQWNKATSGQKFFSQFCQLCGAWYGQLGLEPTLEMYLNHLLLVTAECKRVLKPTGVMYWNHGDNYGGSSMGSWNAPIEIRGKQYRHCLSIDTEYLAPPRKDKSTKAKCLNLQNYRLILRLIDEQDWILRNSVIWNKPNGMPSSVKDRLANKYEPVFMLVKNKKYWFDLDSIREKQKIIFNAPQRGKRRIAKEQLQDNTNPGFAYRTNHPSGKNPGDVWSIPTQPYPEAHFATFPEKLILKPILSSCPEWICKKCGKARVRIKEKAQRIKQHWAPGTERKTEIAKGKHGKTSTLVSGYKFTYKTIGWTDCGCNAGWRAGIILDPFAGSGTTLAMARKYNRQYIGYELNPKYLKFINKRLEAEKTLWDMKSE